MFPLVAIGGVIGAVFSIAKGASWLADQLDSGKSTASAGGKAATAVQPGAFEAALAAQVAGQAVPVSSAAPASMQPLPTHGTDYDTQARMRVGMAAYGHAGTHRGTHARPAPHSNEAPAVG